MLSTPVEGMRELPVTVVPADALASGIVDLLADPARLAALGADGREHVAARYPVAAMLDAYEAAYRELSGGRGR